MSYFDRLCGIIEAHFPVFIPALKDAKIFDFPYVAHEVLPKSYEGDLVDLAASFFLPFRSVAVEDKGSLVVLFDLESEQEGLGVRRGFIDLLPITGDGSAYKEGGRGIDRLDGKDLDWWNHQGYALVSVGDVKRVIPHTGENLEIQGTVFEAVIANKKHIHRKNLHILDEKEIAMRRANNMVVPNPEDPTGALNNVLQAYQEIIYFNQPDKFVLRERRITGKSKGKKKNRPPIPRMKDKARYTILRPNQIREKMGLPTHSLDGRELPDGGPVRAHWKFLRHPRYAMGPNGEQLPEIPIPWGPDRGKMHYRRKRVNAYYRGPKQAVVGNKEYTMMLEI